MASTFVLIIDADDNFLFDLNELIERPLVWIVFDDFLNLHRRLVNNDPTISDKVRNNLNYTLFVNSEREVVQEFWDDYHKKSVVSYYYVSFIYSHLL